MSDQYGEDAWRDDDDREDYRDEPPVCDMCGTDSSWNFEYMKNGDVLCMVCYNALKKNPEFH